MSRRREHLAPGQPNVIVFDSYVSSRNDVTVHIGVHREARLNELEAITRELSTGELKTMRLSAINDAYWVSLLADVALMVSARGSDVRRVLTEIASVVASLDFLSSRTGVTTDL